MVLGLIFIALPIAIYLALVVARPGLWQRAVMGLTGVVLGYLWLGYGFSWGPLWSGDEQTDQFMVLVARLYGLAALAGIFVTTLGRRLARRMGRLGYPLLAGSMFIFVFAPMLTLLGV